MTPSEFKWHRAKDVLPTRDEVIIAYWEVPRPDSGMDGEDFAVMILDEYERWWSTEMWSYYIRDGIPLVGKGVPRDGTPPSHWAYISSPR